MLDNFAMLIDSEKVDRSPDIIIGPLLPVVERDVVALGQHSNKMNPLPPEFRE